MSLFIGIHRKYTPVSDEQAQKRWSQYKEAAVKRGLKPIRVHYNAAQGIALCETEAPSADAVKEAHEEINLVPEEIVEVKTIT